MTKEHHLKVLRSILKETTDMEKRRSLNTALLAVDIYYLVQAARMQEKLDASQKKDGQCHAQKMKKNSVDLN